MSRYDPDERPRHGRTCSSDPEIGCECGLADWLADHAPAPVRCTVVGGCGGLFDPDDPGGCACREPEEAVA